MQETRPSSTCRCPHVRLAVSVGDAAAIADLDSGRMLYCIDDDSYSFYERVGVAGIPGHEVVIYQRVGDPRPASKVTPMMRDGLRLLPREVRREMMARGLGAVRLAVSVGDAAAIADRTVQSVLCSAS